MLRDDDAAGAGAQQRCECAHRARRAEVVDLDVLLDHLAGTVIALDAHDRVGEDEVDPAVALCERRREPCGRIWIGHVEALAADLCSRAA
ncbi:MAG TPA: hypothetical protein VH081_08775 [Solirubrobacteraceae bacterium]|nr:hypothetical protein [Solirubrobacteraceae bacterium]